MHMDMLISQVRPGPQEPHATARGAALNLWIAETLQPSVAGPDLATSSRLHAFHNLQHPDALSRSAAGRSSGTPAPDPSNAIQPAEQ